MTLTSRKWEWHEDMHIKKMVEKHGLNWTRILKGLPNDRTLSAVRNRWQRMINQRNLKKRNRCQICGLLKRGHSCRGTQNKEIVEHDKNDKHDMGDENSDLYTNIQNMIEDLPELFNVVPSELVVEHREPDITMTIVQMASNIYGYIALVRMVYCGDGSFDNGRHAIYGLGESLLALNTWEKTVDMGESHRLMLSTVMDSVMSAIKLLTLDIEPSIQSHENQHMSPMVNVPQASSHRLHR